MPVVRAISLLWQSCSLGCTNRRFYRTTFHKRYKVRQFVLPRKFSLSGDEGPHKNKNGEKLEMGSLEEVKEIPVDKQQASSFCSLHMYWVCFGKLVVHIQVSFSACAVVEVFLVSAKDGLGSSSMLDATFHLLCSNIWCGLGLTSY